MGSQTPDVEPFAEAFKSMWNHLMTIYRETGHTLEHINLGGGIPVNYLRDRSQADELPEHERDMLGADLEPSAVLSEALRVARESARDVEAEHLLDQVTILLEPGRSVIADTGVLLTKVRNIKQRPETGDVWLLTDAGYNLLVVDEQLQVVLPPDFGVARVRCRWMRSTKSRGRCAIPATCISTSSDTAACLTTVGCRAK